MPSRRVNRDHPRSRGVYYAGKAEPRQRWGSSPLARGLRRGGRSGRSPAADHPRSRGVYAVTSPSPVIVAGSSPLARGLRQACLQRALHRGIIPARAGFTDDTAPITLVSTDHPRSRGVYPSRRMSGFGAVGSSPLARGLPHLGDELVHPPGIIPARAGFTSLPTDFSQGGADHPRSRGVYVRDRAKRFGLSGSSPLARGLLILLADLRRLARIIPARAGFTRSGQGHR